MKPLKVTKDMEMDRVSIRSHQSFKFWFWSMESAGLVRSIRPYMSRGFPIGVWEVKLLASGEFDCEAMMITLSVLPSLS